MMYLLLSILSSTMLFLIFKWFAKNEVDNYQAIVVNYIVATSLGILLLPNYNFTNVVDEKWFFNAVAIGIIFFFMFLLIALTSQKIGVSVASVANKMSVVIPVIIAFSFYNDSITFLKVAGIIFALVGVYFASKKSGTIEIDRKYIYLPLILFIGNGLIDTFIKYTELNYVADGEVLAFVPTIFAAAFAAGFIFLLAKRKLKFQRKNIIWGIILGIPNYASIFFLIKTLKVPGYESSVVFPINNMGIVAASVLGAYVIFKEKLSTKNWIGVAISIIAIGMIALSK